MVVNLIPAVSPVQPVTSILPLVFVVAVAMIKEAVEDYVRPSSAAALRMLP